MTVSRPSVKNAVTARICALYGDFSGRSDSGFPVFRIAGVSHAKWDECRTDRLGMWYDVRSSPERRTRPQFNPNVSVPRRTFVAHWHEAGVTGSGVEVAVVDQDFKIRVLAQTAGVVSLPSSPGVKDAR